MTDTSMFLCGRARTDVLETGRSAFAVRRGMLMISAMAV